jgi:phosphoglycolate phosphatase-like HAD superfamily hydrolase
MIRKYKHISFDLDETLVHTLPEYRYELVGEVVNKLGGKPIEDSHTIDQFWLEADRDEIIKNHFGLAPKEFWGLFTKADLPEKRLSHTHAFEDAEPTLKKLKELGKTVSIITGSPSWITEMEIKRLNNAPHDYCLSLKDSRFLHKPDPGGLKFVMEKFLFGPDETIYIGNSNEDASFAKNAGVDFIYLERGDYKFDLKNHAIAVIRSLDELFNTIETSK